MKIFKPLIGALLAAMLAVGAQAQQAITLHGASQFGDDHAFTKAMVRFEELVKKYYGKPISFVLHKNSELGLEKDYFAYMNQGKAVDYAIVSPAHMSTFSKAAPFIDAPFLFRDLDHWNKVLDQDLLRPIAEEIEQRAEVAMERVADQLGRVGVLHEARGGRDRAGDAYADARVTSIYGGTNQIQRDILARAALDGRA